MSTQPSQIVLLQLEHSSSQFFLQPWTNWSDDGVPIYLSLHRQPSDPSTSAFESLQTSHIVSLQLRQVSLHLWQLLVPSVLDGSPEYPATQTHLLVKLTAKESLHFEQAPKSSQLRQSLLQVGIRVQPDSSGTVDGVPLYPDLHTHFASSFNSES